MAWTKRKPVSYQSKKFNRPMFTIQLIEDENGRVSVLADMVGTGPNAIEIGMEIMQNLELASFENPDRLAVQPLNYCKNYQ